MYERLSIDTVRRTITLSNSDSGKENQTLELNRSEYNLLLAFCDSHGEVVDKQKLIELGWPGRVVGENSLAVAIMKLRKKLEMLALGFEINNLPGEGYVFINTQNVSIEQSSGAIEEPQPLNSQVGEKDNVDELGTTEPYQQNVPQFDEENERDEVKHTGWRALIRQNLFWEVSIGILVGVLLFFFIYREAFECFDCFGGVGG